MREISSEVAWQRRLARALAMGAGERDASGMENYERLPVYAVEDDFEAIHLAGAEAVRWRVGGKLPTMVPQIHAKYAASVSALPFRPAVSRMVADCGTCGGHAPPQRSPRRPGFVKLAFRVTLDRKLN